MEFFSCGQLASGKGVVIGSWSERSTTSTVSPVPLVVWFLARSQFLLDTSLLLGDSVVAKLSWKVCI